MTEQQRPRAALLFAPGIEQQVLGAGQRERLEAMVPLIGAFGSADELIGHPAGGDTQLIVTSWGAPRLDRELLDRLPRLEAVFYAAGSVRDIVTEEFWSRDIPIVSAAEANNEPVAEFVVAQTVLALKNAHRRAIAMRQLRGLPGREDVPGIYGQRVGLVSFGSIARKVAARLGALSADVIVWDPYLTDDDASSAGVRRAGSLDEFFEECRVVSVHTPWIAGVTDGLVGGAQIERMQQGATFINTARGAVVDEPGLIDVLGRRPDILAILDVTWPEPPERSSPLYTLDNVLLTGHAAGSLGTERLRMGELIVDEIGRWLVGDALRHRVTAEAARLRA